MFDVLAQQKTNFDHFNGLKTLILSIIPRTLYIYQAEKTGCACIPEGGPIRINTVFMFNVN